MLHRATAIATVFATVLLALAACSGTNITGLDQANYNATYAGSATFDYNVTTANASAAPYRLTMSLSQLGQDFTGTFVVSDTASQTVYAGSVTGKTSNTGADFTFVVPAPCAGTLYGSFTVAESKLSGTAKGRDCNAGSRAGPNVEITFTGLARQ